MGVHKFYLTANLFLNGDFAFFDENFFHMKMIIRQFSQRQKIREDSNGWQLSPLPVRCDVTACTCDVSQMRQMKADKKKYQIEMWEATPYVELFLQSTVPLACPGCWAAVQAYKHVGLTLSNNCSVTISASDEPLTKYSVLVRAVQTPGANSRVVKLKLKVSTNVTLWDEYKLDDIFVSPLLILAAAVRVSGAAE